MLNRRRLSLQIVGRVGIARVEGEHRVANDVLVLAAEALLDQGRQLVDVEVENPRQKAQDEDILALVLGGAADRLDGAARDRHADRREALVLGVGFDVVGVVDQHTARSEEFEVALVAVLIERYEVIRLVPGGEDVAGAHAHLKNGRDRRKWSTGSSCKSSRLGRIGRPAGPENLRSFEFRLGNCRRGG